MCKDIWVIDTANLTHYRRFLRSHFFRRRFEIICTTIFSRLNQSFLPCYLTGTKWKTGCEPIKKERLKITREHVKAFLSFKLAMMRYFFKDIGNYRTFKLGVLGPVLTLPYLTGSNSRVSYSSVNILRRLISQSSRYFSLKVQVAVLIYIVMRCLLRFLTSDLRL